MARPPEIVEFVPDDASAVLARMADLGERRHGWLTLHPGVDADDVPPPRGIFGLLFSGRGPAVPVANWVTGERTGRTEHVSIGVQHAKGPKAVRILEEAGIAVPKEWQVLADHPKRGLVVAVPLNAEHDAVLDWLLRAAASLSTIPLTGTWQALVYVG